MCWRGMSHVFNCFKMAYVLKFDYSETFLSVIYIIKVSFRSFVGIKAYCVVVKLMSLYVMSPASYQNGSFLRPGVLGQISARDWTRRDSRARARTSGFQSRRRTRTFFTFDLEACKQVEALRRFPDPTSVGLVYIWSLSYIYIDVDFGVISIMKLPNEKENNLTCAIRYRKLGVCVTFYKNV